MRMNRLSNPTQQNGQLKQANEKIKVPCPTGLKFCLRIYEERIKITQQGHGGVVHPEKKSKPEIK